MRDEILNLEEQRRVVPSLYYSERLTLHKIASLLQITEYDLQPAGFSRPSEGRGVVRVMAEQAVICPHCADETRVNVPGIPASNDSFSCSRTQCSSCRKIIHTHREDRDIWYSMKHYWHL